MTAAVSLTPDWHSPEAEELPAIPPSLQTLLDVYCNERAELTRAASGLLRRYRDAAIDAEELVHLAMLSFWRNRDNLPELTSRPIGFFVWKMKSELSNDVKKERVQERYIARHCEGALVGMAWGHPKIGSGKGKHCVNVGTGINAGPRLLPELDEVAVSPACARFLRALVPLMPFPWIVALALHYVAGYSIPQVARALGLTSGGANKSMIKARRIIRQHPHLAQLLHGDNDPTAEPAVAV